MANAPKIYNYVRKADMNGKDFDFNCAVKGTKTYEYLQEIRYNQDGKNGFVTDDDTMARAYYDLPFRKDYKAQVTIRKVPIYTYSPVNVNTVFESLYCDPTPVCDNLEFTYEKTPNDGVQIPALLYINMTSEQTCDYDGNTYNPGITQVPVDITGLTFYKSCKGSFTPSRSSPSENCLHAERTPDIGNGTDINHPKANPDVGFLGSVFKIVTAPLRLIENLLFGHWEFWLFVAIVALIFGLKFCSHKGSTEVKIIEKSS